MYQAWGLFQRKESSSLKADNEKPSIINGFGGGLERLPTGQRPVMLHTHEVTGSSPVVSTKKEVTFVYQKLLLFLSKP